MTEKEKFIEELRCLEDFYEAAPDDLPRPFINRDHYVDKDELPVVLAHCKPLKKSIFGNSIKLTKTLVFGELSFFISFVPYLMPYLSCPAVRLAVGFQGLQR